MTSTHSRAEESTDASYRKCFEDLRGPTLSKVCGLGKPDLSNRVSNIGDKLVANGGYGDVFKGFVVSKHLPHSLLPRNIITKVALKRPRRIDRRSTKDIWSKSLLGELHIWSGLENPNVLQCLGYLLEDSYVALVSEWMENGTLRSYVDKNPECDLKLMFHGVAKGLEYLHRQGIIHCDIKTDNILISPDGEPLICDFGISRMDSLPLTWSSSNTTSGNPRGSTRWMAIELLRDSSPIHTEGTDIWAYGMTLYEVLSLELPYMHLKNDAFVTVAILRGKLPPRPTRIDGQEQLLQLWSICEGCWERDPSYRLKLSQIIQRLSPPGSDARKARGSILAVQGSGMVVRKKYPRPFFSETRVVSNKQLGIKAAQTTH